MQIVIKFLRVSSKKFFSFPMLFENLNRARVNFYLLRSFRSVNELSLDKRPESSRKSLAVMKFLTVKIFFPRLKANQSR